MAFRGKFRKNRKMGKRKGRKTYRRYKKLYKRTLDSRVHRFKELLRTKILVNSDTAQTPTATDPAGTGYKYVSGKLEDFIDFASSAATVGAPRGNNAWLNNVRNGGLKTIFDRIRIDYISFKFISPFTSSDMLTGANNQQGTFNLYTSKDKDGGTAITSLYYMRERGNVKVKRMGGYPKVHIVGCKPYTDFRSVGQDNQASVELAKPLYWFDIQKLYEGFTTGVPRLNLGHWFIEVPTDITGSITAPAINAVIDVQITVYYSCKNQL